MYCLMCTWNYSHQILGLEYGPILEISCSSVSIPIPEYYYKLITAALIRVFTFLA